MRKTHTSQQTSKRSTHTFCNIFWNILNIDQKNSFRRSNKKIQYQVINNTKHVWRITKTILIQRLQHHNCKTLTIATPYHWYQKILEISP